MLAIRIAGVLEQALLVLLDSLTKFVLEFFVICEELNVQMNIEMNFRGGSRREDALLACDLKNGPRKRLGVASLEVA